MLAIIEHDLDSGHNVVYSLWSDSKQYVLLREYLEEAEDKKLEIECHYEKKGDTNVFVLQIEQL